MFTFVADQMLNYFAVLHMAKDILKANDQSRRIRVKNFDAKIIHLIKALF